MMFDTEANLFQPVSCLLCSGHRTAKSKCYRTYRFYRCVVYVLVTNCKYLILVFCLYLRSFSKKEANGCSRLHIEI